ncbi:MAG: RrF2 family transcriptional regulator [Parahaliea sp.]
MRITRHTDYAFRVLMFVALKEGDTATISEIAESYGISRHHLTKVVNRLHQKGHLVATRGKNGGLTLPCPPEDINVGEVFRDMESELAVVECMDDPHMCVLSNCCELMRLFAGASSAFMTYLDRYTLRDLLPGRDRSNLRRILLIST